MPTHTPHPSARRSPRMIEPSLLLLLAEREHAYGYQLRDEVNALGLVEREVEAAGIYRSLRDLEARGLVRSQWDTRGAGPARRCYELTELGIKGLTLWGDRIKRQQEALMAYVQRYRAAMSKIRRVRRV